MKGIALVVLTVALVLSLLVGCAGPATPTATPSPTATSASPTPTPTPTSGGATVGVWEQLPSFGGEVFWCLAIDPGNPQTLYAGIVGDGICKSSNGGASWGASSSGLPSRDVVSLALRNLVSLALDPSNPQALYASISGGGVYKSSDGGVNWAVSPPGCRSARTAMWCPWPSTPPTPRPSTPAL